METTVTGGGSSPSALRACIGDVGELYDLASDKNAGARELLTHKIVNILDIDLSPREGELVADILIELLNQAQKDLRKALSEQLCALEEVPLRVILQLANDEIDVAEPVLVNSPILSDYDLLYIIKSKPAEYWRAIAKRREQGAQVIDMLSDTGDFETALNLVENKNIELTQHAVSALADLAQENETISMPLSQRSEISEDLSKQLYIGVGADVKNFIKDNFDSKDSQQESEVSKALDQVVDELSTAGSKDDLKPEEYMISVAKSFKQRNMLTSKLLIGTLRRGQLQSFVAQLAVYTGFSVELILPNLTQANGRGIAMIAKAAGMDKRDFSAIYMLGGKIWNNGALVGAQDIKMALGFFNSVTEEQALALIKKNARMSYQKN